MGVRETLVSDGALFYSGILWLSTHAAKSYFLKTSWFQILVLPSCLCQSSVKFFLEEALVHAYQSAESFAEHHVLIFLSFFFISLVSGIGRLNIF